MNKSILFLVVLATTLFVWGAAWFLAAGAPMEDETVYIASKLDNICGLDDPRTLSRPAVVAYSMLMDATPQMKRIQREKIDPDSAKGIVLVSLAQALVLEKCTKVSKELGYCSVWRAIRRRDGKPVDDITERVKKKILEDVGDLPPSPVPEPVRESTS